MKTVATVTLLLAAAAALAAADPWALPSVDISENLVRLNASDRSYAIEQSEKVPAEAAYGDRVEAPLSKAHRARLDECRALLGDGAHEAVEKAVAELLAADAANYDALVIRASSLHAQGRDEDALAALRDSLIGNRRNPAAWKLLEAVAAKLGKKVTRPRLDPQGWIAVDKTGDVRLGWFDWEKDEDQPWLSYAIGRAAFRFEGPHGKRFGRRTAHRFTFYEQLWAVACALQSAEGERVSAGLKRLQTEKRRRTIVPFTFFALYPEPIPAEPEKDFDLLRPKLVKYFDRHIIRTR